MGSGRLDKEIVRVSHCGYLSLENFHGLDASIRSKLENRTNETTTATSTKRLPSRKMPLFKGCLSVCQQDECNSTPSYQRMFFDKKKPAIYYFYVFISLIFANFLLN